MVLSMLKFESCIKDKVKSLKFSHSFIIWGSDEANPTAIIPQHAEGTLVIKNKNCNVSDVAMVGNFVLTRITKYIN